MFGTSLRELRDLLDVTQPEMAEKMGMPVRSYQAIEINENPVRPIHMRAGYMAALMLADERDKADRLPSDLRALVISLNRQVG